MLFTHLLHKSAYILKRGENVFCESIVGHLFAVEITKSEFIDSIFSVILETLPECHRLLLMLFSIVIICPNQGDRNIMNYSQILRSSQLLNIYRMNMQQTLGGELLRPPPPPHPPPPPPLPRKISRSSIVAGH